MTLRMGITRRLRGTVPVAPRGLVMTRKRIEIGHPLAVTGSLSLGYRASSPYFGGADLWITSFP